MYKEITLKEGDKLRILPETKFFYFGCCTCNMIHRITVEHTKEGILLGFFEHKSKKKRSSKTPVAVTMKSARQAFESK